MTRLSTSSSTWNLASTKWVHPQWFTQGCDFKWAASSRQKKTRENRNWKPTLYSHYEWPPGRAAEPQPAPQPQPRAGQGQAIRVSNAKINATHRCQLPVTLAQVPHSDYYPIYMQRRRLFSAASWIFFLNTSSFRFVPRHLAAILCQFPVHCVWVSLAPAQIHKQNQIQTKTGTVAGKQQLEWSFSLSPSASLYHSPFGWVPSVVQ